MKTFFDLEQFLRRGAANSECTLYVQYRANTTKRPFEVLAYKDGGRIGEGRGKTLAEACEALTAELQRQANHR